MLAAQLQEEIQFLMRLSSLYNEKLIRGKAKKWTLKGSWICRKEEPKLNKNQWSAFLLVNFWNAYSHWLDELIPIWILSSDK